MNRSAILLLFCTADRVRSGNMVAKRCYRCAVNLRTVWQTLLIHHV
ncbi:hypothetical protein RMSM_04920 [Rhodopirellula maiorica SM1]|uniref:Uncharacterized protein n=1 Tax=Rhodopirellula maiorica SM1 TaxID=1265738 RepID=M5RFM6_9BACT|nr:hypothetical protein RMSM_04920 [Rhodopirellula maiorica SM1]